MRYTSFNEGASGRLRAVAGACLCLLGVTACAGEPVGAGAVPVEVVRVDGRYQLLRGGEPYDIRGAGVEFWDPASLARHGGNTFRTWRTDNTRDTGQVVLDRAASLGLAVAMGIEMGKERHGFDYDDEEAVAAQLAHARGEVLKYKDHPALLAWIIGNELNHDHTNPKFLDAINEISEMIHAVDGKHPTTTTLSVFPDELIALVDERAPDLDIISVQSYADIVNLPRHLGQSASSRPYWVTEFGAIGHWETASTAWGAPIENNSSQKAANYLKSYRVAIEPYRDKVIGSFVFYWGQKQERTPTWYGMFLEDGAETEAIDVMHYIWNGAWPDNRAPRVDLMLLNRQTAFQSVTLAPGQTCRAYLQALDPDGDALRYRWTVMRESTATSEGGDPEYVPEDIGGLVSDQGDGWAELTAPGEPGAYRLFGYVYDPGGKAGHANIPFRVE